VALSLDKFIGKVVSDRFRLQFPLLSIVYVSIGGLDSCILMALFHPMSSPCVVRIRTHDKVDILLESLAEINRQSTAMSAVVDSQSWWTQKRILDAKLESIMQDFENDVLGAWKGLLTPLQFRRDHSSIRSAMLAALQTYSQNERDSAQREIESCLGISLRSVSEASIGRYPLGLLLGRHMHRIPWESLPCVLHHEISITRVPSLKLMALQTAKALPRSLDPSSAFYILNPAGDLPSTENTFRPLFSRFSWNGLVRTRPSPETIERAIRDKDLFVYCGHGSGHEYYNFESLVDDSKPCKSSLVLMGCSSGELIDNGDIDPTGVPYHCLAAGAGAVVANLWNVTDRDIDRFLASLLGAIVGGGPCQLENAIRTARKACKLKYLTGAAPVMYGFPTLVARR
jgi:separase